MIKVLIHQEDMTNIDIHALDNKVSKYMKQKLTK